MKKLLIIILIVLLGVTAYMMVFKNIKIGNWKTTNLEELKALDQELDSDIAQARELNETTYTTQIDELNESIKQLATSKETYEAKVQNLSEEAELGIISVKNYKIEYLWTKIENYAKDNGVWLKLDLIENGGNNTYNLNITLQGTYISITDVIYAIEKDDTLDFTIEEFKMTPSTVTKTTNTSTSGTITPSDANNDNSTNNNSTDSTSSQTVVVDSDVLQATFTIKNVQIELD